MTEFVLLQQERAAQDRSAEELRTRMQHMATEIVLRGRELEEESRRLERQAAEFARSNEDLAQFAHLVSHEFARTAASDLGLLHSCWPAAFLSSLITKHSS